MYTCIYIYIAGTEDEGELGLAERVRSCCVENAENIEQQI
jgi:hypothetical protein